MSRRRANCSDLMSPRSGRPKIAHQFIGGFTVIIKDPSPRSGRKTFLHSSIPTDLARLRVIAPVVIAPVGHTRFEYWLILVIRLILSSASRTCFPNAISSPATNRWAIFGRPLSRTTSPLERSVRYQQARFSIFPARFSSADESSRISPGLL